MSGFSEKFHPVLFLPETYDLLDFSRPGPQKRRSPYSLGRYDEKRVGIYGDSLFSGIRNIHVGVDIGAPTGTPVFAFYDGEIVYQADNQSPGDYGPTLVSRHHLSSQTIFVLWGHLSRDSLQLRKPGQFFSRGDCLGYLGKEEENGNWPPHLHIQWTHEDPKKADMPGAVSDEDRESALKLYPDPRLILGLLY